MALTWETPADNGSALTGYEYRHSSDGARTWAPDWGTIRDSEAETTSHRLERLTNGTAYTFEVRTVNGVGAGDSARVAATPGRTPDPVRNLRRAAAGNGQVTLSWVAPLSDGGLALTGYEYRQSADSGRTWPPDWTAVAPPLATSLTRTGLESCTFSTFEVRARNPAGPGDSRRVSVPRPYWSGSLAADTTWSGRVCVDGDVTIPAGVTLTLAAETEMAFHPGGDATGGGDDPARPELIVAGTLSAGTGVTFRSVDIYFPSTSDWSGIRVDSGGSADLSGATIRDGAGCVQAHESGTVTLTNTTLSPCGQTVSLSSRKSQVGMGLTASLAGVSAGQWQWQGRNDRDSAPAWADLSGLSPSAGYTPVAADLGRQLRAMVRYGPGSGRYYHFVQSAPTRAVMLPSPTGFAVWPDHEAVLLLWDASADASITHWRYGTREGTAPIEWTEVADGEVARLAYGGRMRRYIRVAGLTNGVAYRFKVRAKAGTAEGVPTDLVGVTPSKPQVAYGASSYEAQEGGAAVSVGVALSAQATQAVPLPVTVTADSGTEAGDYTVEGLSAGAAGAYTVSFALGDSTQSFTLRANEDDDGDDETVSLGFGSLSGLGIGAGTPASAQVTLVESMTAPPPPPSGPTSVSYAENRTDSVATYTLTSGLTLQLGGADADTFRVSGDTLYFRRPPDYEQPADTGGSRSGDNIYVVRLQTHDGSLSSDPVEVRVTVTDVEEPGTVTLSSSQPQVGTAVTARLEDPDGSVADTLWQWQHRADATAGWTNLAGSSAQLSGYTPGAADGGQQLRATVDYSDGHGPDKSAQSGATDPVRARPGGTVSSSAASYVALEDGDTATVRVNLSPAPTEAVAVKVTVRPGPNTEAGDFAAVDLASDSTVSFTATASDSFKIVARSDADSEDETVLLGFKELPAGIGPGAPATATVNLLDATLKVVGPARVSVEEEGSRSVAPYRATDPWDGPVAPVRWSLTGADSTWFQMHGNTLEFESEPDYEQPLDKGSNHVYDVNLQAVYGGAYHSAPFPVAVTVTNKDEPGRVSVSPSSAQVGRELQATLTDPDGSVSDTLWQWQYRAEATAAWDDLTSPEARFSAYRPVAADAGQYLRATVGYTDGHGPDKSAQSGATDAVQEASTVTIVGPDSVWFAENGTDTVATYRATDGQGARLAWRLGGPDAGAFTVRGDTLSFTRAPDFEGPTDAGGDKVYNVTVTAGEGAGSRSEAVVVTVTNVDEPPPPVGVSDTTFAENGTGGVATYTATDPEGAAIDWSLGGADADTLQIDAQGRLSFRAAPNYEAPADANRDRVYQVAVVASDGALSASLAVSVRVTNVEEPGTVTLSSTQPRVGTELTAELHDPDGIEPGARWQWQRRADATAAWERVSSSSSARSPPSYPAASGYRPAAADVGQQLRATVVDYSDGHGDNKQAQSAPTEPVQEAVSTVTIVGPDSVWFAENGTDTVATYRATDGQGARLAWRLGGPDVGAFTVRGDTLSFTRAPDFEGPTDAGGDKVYNVTVTAGEGAGSRSEAVVVTVTNVDEPPPPVGVSDTTFAENGTGGVATYTATDPEGAAIDWSLGGADADTLQIDAQGRLSFRAAPNYEAPADANRDRVYQVAVVASDGALSASLAVSVRVTNVEEPGTVTLSSTQPRVDVPLRADLSDPDGGVTNVRWAWLYSSAQGARGVWEEPGGTDRLWSTFTPYSLLVGQQVWARAVYDDGHGADKQAQSAPTEPVQEAVSTVTIVGPDSVWFAENGTDTVATYRATDGQGARLAWRLGGPDVGAFTVEGDTLSFTRAPDFEGPADAGGDNEYHVTVTAGEGAGSRSEAVVVTVTNVDEPGTVTLSSTQPQVGMLLTAELEDPDGNEPGARWQWQRRADATAEWESVSSSARSGRTPSYPVSSGYRPVAAEVGQQLRATVVDYSDGHGDNKQAQSDPTEPVVDVPSVPVLTVDAGDRQVTLNWEAASDNGSPIEWYEYRQASGSVWTTVLGGGEARTKTVTGLTNGTVYTFEVRAKNGVGYGPAASRSATPAGMPGMPVLPNRAPQLVGPSAPSFAENGRVVASYTATDPEGDALRWPGLSGADGQAFQLAGSGLTRVLQFKTAPNFEAPTDQDGDKVYRVGVGVSDARDEAGAPDLSVDTTITVSVTVTNVDEAGTVTLSSTQPQVGTELTAELHDPDGIEPGARWQWQRRADATAAWESVSSSARSGRTPSYPVASGYRPGAADVGQQLRATVVDYSDGHGDNKQAQSAPTEPVVDVPTLVLTVDAGDGQVTLNWEVISANGSPIQWYEYRQHSASDSWSDWSTVSEGGSARTKTVTGLTNGTVYTFEVRAKNGVGYGPAASESATPAGEPGPPGSLSAVRGDEQVHLSWTAASDSGSLIQWYEYRQHSASDSWSDWSTVSEGGSARTKTVTGLTNGTVYTFEVRAKNGVGYGPAASESATPVAPNRAPGLTGPSAPSFAENGTGGVASYTATDPEGDAIAWAALSGADGRAFRLTGSGLTRVLQFKTAPNFEAPTDQDGDKVYRVGVGVSDGRGGDGQADAAVDTTITVSVTVTNVDEAGTVTLSSTQPQVGVPLRADLSDPDGGVTNVRWSWSYSSARGARGVWEEPGGTDRLWSTFTPYSLLVGQQVRARAVYDDGQGADKQAQSGATDAVVDVPEPPVLTVDVGDGQVTLNWEAASANGSTISWYEYRKRRGSGSWSGWSTVAGYSSARTKTVTGLTNGTVYTFEVRAKNGVGYGAAASKSATPAGVPGTPGSLSAVRGDEQVSLSWTAASDNGSSIQRYEYRKRSGSGSWSGWSTVAGYSSARTRTVTGLTNGTVYTFEVRAKNGVGYGAAASKSATPAGVPGTPGSLSAVRGDEQVSLSWTAASANGSTISWYEYRKRSGSGSWSGWSTVAGYSSARTRTVTGLTNGTVYTFEVRAKNGVGYGPAASKSATPAGVPGTPGSLSAVRGDEQVSLSWTAASANGSSIQRYEYRKRSGSGSWSGWSTVTGYSSARTKTVTGLTNGTVYTFEVRAKNGVGYGPAASKSATPAGVAGTPGSLSASACDGQVRLSWTAASTNGSSIYWYECRRRRGSGSWSSWSTVAGYSSARTKTVTGLTNGWSYTFEVRAKNGVGYGPAASDTAIPQATPPTGGYRAAAQRSASSPAPPPDPVTGLTAQAGPHQAVLHWTDPGDSTITYWQYRTQADAAEWDAWQTIPHSEATTTRHRVAPLAHGVAYHIQVRAVNPTGTGAQAVAVAVTPLRLAIQAVPNPFNPSTTLRFDLPTRATVSLVLYNVSGQRVKTLLPAESLPAGAHTWVWDGRDDAGAAVASGVYVYRLRAGEQAVVGKITLLR